ncbi:MULTISPECIES: NUDIX hydrolase [unclassified Beijerinckia]|uniref:NUDIX hydrolase n=1 Tax=unclassified Beijerinckia TaxID=2638183 RepID=UPI0008983FDF|nr:MULTISPECIES: NUDIX hydrolase [unclassified Beijerinckia]MDH7799670.1 8-oxo-dGTP pyrophosphatase MutT (NUDIX family) [Beijerinckia sp. GAS462]SEB49077.1 hypothetical protein SAMN05443249_0162 [Beijerinckia sp. 28-YEA-48]
MNVTIEAVDAIESTYVPREWAFALERKAEIDAHWAKLTTQKPLLYDGRVLLMDHWEIVERNGMRVLRTRHFSTDYRSFLAWRDFGFPDPAVRNCFAAAALLSRDDVFLLGEMASHTANAGKVYFAAGTPDMGDVQGDEAGARVDLAGSVLRELAEETGITAEQVQCEARWTVVFEGPRVGCMKIVRSPLDAAALMAQVDQFLRSDPQAELVRLHQVSTNGDLRPDIMPGFIIAYLDRMLGQIAFR